MSHRGVSNEVRVISGFVGRFRRRRGRVGARAPRGCYCEAVYGRKVDTYEDSYWTVVRVDAGCCRFDVRDGLPSRLHRGLLGHHLLDEEPWSDSTARRALRKCSTARPALGSPSTCSTVRCSCKEAGAAKSRRSFFPFVYAGYDEKASADQQLAQNLRTSAASAGGIAVSVRREGGTNGLGANTVVRLPDDFDGTSTS